MVLGGTSLALTHLLFWGMNAGLAVFVVGLATNTQVLKQVGAPTMGVCLLIGLAVFAVALLPVRQESRADASGAPA